MRHLDLLLIIVLFAGTLLAALFAPRAVDAMARGRSDFNSNSAIPHKGGYNDLSRWEAFGGKLKRPDPPSQNRRHRPF